MPISMLIFFMIVVGIPVIGGIGMSAFQRWLKHKEKMSQLIADQTAEKAAQYAAHVERIEARLRVVEQIVTDSGAQTAAQIEALRDQLQHATRRAEELETRATSLRGRPEEAEVTLDLAGEAVAKPAVAPETTP